MASPPFYVFVAAGLAGAARGGRGRLAVAAGCGLVLAGMAVAGFRFYADPAYAKDDHRALADLVRRQALPGDRLAVTDPVLGVLYGALLPGLPVQTLPPLLPSGAPDDRPPGELLRPVMADLAASSGRLWFVDAADDLGAWLDANALHVDRRVFPARTIALDLDAWESEPNLRAHQAPERRTDVTMGPLRLLGWSALPESLPAGRTARLRMVWLTPTEGPLPVLKLALRLWGPDGHLYGQGDHEPFHGLRATADWPAAQTVYAPHELDIGAGTPPGDYRLEATLYDPATGQSWPPAGPAALGILHVGRPERPLPAAALPIPRRLSARGPDVDLIGWEPAAEPDGGWLPGGAMPLAAWVRFRRAPAGGCPRLKAELADGRGRVRAEAEAEVFGCVNRAPGDLHRLPLGLALPTEEGDYSLRLRLIGPDGRARLLWRGRPLALVPARAVWLGRIGVAAQPLVTELPGGARRVGATIGEQAELAGWAGLAEGQAVTAGEILALTLFWRGGTAPRPAWDVTVQLLPLGPDGRPAGPPAAQHDGPPAGGARPASAWREGEVVADEHRLALPEGLAPGTYLLIAALYDPARPDGPRPAVLQGGRERDAAHLARIAVRAP